MTWKELKDKLDKLSDKQLSEEVVVWNYRISPMEGTLDTLEEDQLFNNDWDNSMPKSMLDKESLEDKGTYIIAKKNMLVIKF